MKKEGECDFSGVHMSVNLSSGDTSFEIGIEFRTRIEFRMRRLISFGVERMIEQAKVMQGSSQEMCSLLQPSKVFEDKSANYSCSIAQFGYKNTV